MSAERLTGEQLGALPDCVCFNLRWVTRLVTQFYDRELRRFGIKATQWSILSSVAAKAGATMAGLADWLGMERTTLLRNLQPMIRDGLLEVRQAADARHSEVVATKAGQRLLARVYPAWEKAQRRMLGHIGKDRWAAMVRDLEAATEKMTKG